MIESVREIPEAARVDVRGYERRYLIGGELRVWNGEATTVESVVPVQRSDGTWARHPIGQMASLDRREALAALASARAAWDDGRGAWPTMRVAGRVAAVERFAREMRQSREDVVRLLMLEIGKSRKDAESEFDRTVRYVHDTATAVKELDRNSSRFALEEGFIGQIRRAPLGVVLCMGPFNYPLNETYTTLIPALIMGNTVVSKLPKYGGLSHLPLLEAMRDCFPPGVVNVIQGDGPTVVGPIMESGEVDVLAFIGTSRVANILKKQHPKAHRLRSITGLEAKNPAVVLPSADLELAAAECTSGALSFNGQRCTAIKLIFVHESVAASFVDELVARVDLLKAGLPWEPGVQLTPLPEHGKADVLSRLVEDAVEKGARVLNRDGGRAQGTFFSPAVVYPIGSTARLFHEEQFGPIVPIAVYRTEDEIDSFMRKSDYGQQISIFGADPGHIARMIDVLVNQVCRINLNSQCRRGPDTFPFTGRKDSAEGTLSVSDALRAFSIRTMVAIASNDRDKQLVSEIVGGRLSAFLSNDFLL